MKFIQITMCDQDLLALDDNGLVWRHDGTWEHGKWEKVSMLLDEGEA